MQRRLDATGYRLYTMLLILTSAFSLHLLATPQYLENIASNNKSGFIVGSSLTIADVYLANVFGSFAAGQMDHIPAVRC